MTFLFVSTVEVNEEPFAVASVFLSTAALKVTSCSVAPPRVTFALPVPASFTMKPACSLVMLPSLAATLSLNVCAKPTVTVGSPASLPMVTVVSPVVPRNWMFGFDVLLRVKFFLVATSAPLIENCVEMLVIGIPLLLMFSMTLLMIWFVNVRLSTPYLIVAPSLLTVSP